MPLTPFFLHGSPSEQRLIQDLVNEHLRNFGQDILYLPRRIVNEQTVIKEITASRFDDSFRIEAYLSNFDGYVDAKAVKAGEHFFTANKTVNCWQKLSNLATAFDGCQSL